ncbi:MAG TPA: flagellar biosynthetic protein FliR [Baekduia sp.]|uniref:flagellar biosynthetic protein FliR n=1 Tax=Baekduia sp. TaxID=2600305 RepID=UPI002D781977|nr:flagellar biosynthetic protein FliR [Baekduia sp.]HET6508885.1 flagellar biosynthetic protein FliR [Baekduia sp.]
MGSQLQQSAQTLVTEFGEQRVLAFFLVLARISPLFLLAPLFSSKMVQPRVKSVLAVGLAVGISPIVAADTRLPTDVLAIAGLLGKELLVGSAFAYTLAATFAAISVAGSFLDTTIGFSYGSLVDPVNGNQAAVLSTAYSMIGLLVFIAIGGDAWVIKGLAKTYDVVGLVQYPSLNHVVTGATAAFTGIFTAALQVAGPVLLALILTDAAFGMVTRVVPTLNAFQVAVPAKVVLGLLLVGASMPFVANWLGASLQEDVRSALETLRIG